MAFSKNDSHRLDLKLLSRGCVTLYWKKALFEEAIAELQRLRYRKLHFRFQEVNRSGFAGGSNS